MATRKGKYHVKTASGYDQVLLETILSQVKDSPIKSLERNKAYSSGDICAESTAKGVFLVCTTSGTTSNSLPSGYASAQEGATITDGYAKFVVHRFDKVASTTSPAFTGIPTAPTPSGSAGESQQIATVGWVQGVVTGSIPANPVMTGATTTSNGKQGLVPAPSSGSNNRYLNSEGQWKTIEIKTMVGASAYSEGEAGLVPAPSSGSANRYLTSAGAWKTIEVMTGATASQIGISGLVPTPAAGNANRYLNADGTWKEISPMQGATTTSPGTSGLVPSPTAGSSIRYLCSDGTWKEVDLDSAKTKMVVYS